MSAGMLASVRVLDASVFFAAPLLSALLADHGADVVMLEPPAGHAFRSSPFWPLTARGKRSVAIDPADRETVHRLVAAADVVVVNEPSSRLARRGLDPDTLLRLNPSAVVAHVSGYGADGPYAGQPGNGTLAEAFAGLTHVTGHTNGPPVLPSALLGDSVMAWTGAFGVLAAVLAVRTGAAGRVLDVNPVDAMLHAVATSLMGIAEHRPAPQRTGGPLKGAALRGVWAAADGKWVAASVSTDRQRQTLASLVGAPHAEGADLETAVRTWIGGQSRSDILKAAFGARLPLGPVNDADDLARDPHVQARGALRTVRTADGDQITVPAPTPRTSGTATLGEETQSEQICSRGAQRTEMLPAAGQHTNEVLAEWTLDRP